MNKEDRRGTGYQAMYGRTDRLPATGPLHYPTVAGCNNYHRRTVNNALVSSYEADRDNVAPYIWLESQFIFDKDGEPLRGLYGIPLMFAVKIVRGSRPNRSDIIDFGYIYDNFGKSNEKEIAIQWDYAQGLWVLV